MKTADEYLSGRLEERVAAGNLRQLPVGAGGIDFCSNDYLGIASNGLQGGFNIGSGGYGATGSRLISGNSALIEDTERFIAHFHKSEAALLFNSGYDANIGLLSAIAGRDTIFLYDELCHASIIDGIRLSICRHKYRFSHNSLAEIETLLQKHAAGSQLYIVVESVYSMDGDTAPLAEIVALCKQFGAQLIVDEAHATGVTGVRGAGSVCAMGLEKDVFARVHTFGKALGCHGAVVLGSSLLRRYLINFARSFIYTTALPPHSVAVIAAVYRYLASAEFTNEDLHKNISYFKEQAKAAGVRGLAESSTAIQALITGGNEYTRSLAGNMQQAGLRINAILHPTVAEGKERLRICLHSFNTFREIDELIDLLPK